MKLRSRPVPAWAKKVIAQVCTEEGIKEPRVTWQKVDRDQSSGMAWPYHFRITAGNYKKEVKEVLLHELTHCVRGQSGASKGSRGHDAEFYATLFRIAKRHQIGAAFIKRREGWYKPRGIKQGYALYLRRLREGA